MNPIDTSREWLEADGLGGFASGTVSGIRTRRYHALLLSGQNGPAGRMALVNGFDAFVDSPAGRQAISSQAYSPSVVNPDGAERIVDFASEPWPRWVYELADGTRLEQQVFVPHGRQLTVVSWRLLDPRPGINLHVRPFLSGRDYHALQHENPGFRFAAECEGERTQWTPYSGVPSIVSFANATYAAEPHWYRNFCYAEERARGLDFAEDLAAPGVF